MTSVVPEKKSYFIFQDIDNIDIYYSIKEQDKYYNLIEKNSKYLKFEENIIEHVTKIKALNSYLENKNPIKALNSYLENKKYIKKDNGERKLYTIYDKITKNVIAIIAYISNDNDNDNLFIIQIKNKIFSNSNSSFVLEKYPSVYKATKLKDLYGNFDLQELLQ